MEREAFRQRMQQYKQARENNPQLKYWDWKKENDLGYQLYKNNLPSNLQVETDDYDLYGAYESNMQPELNEDGTYHLGSRDPYTGRILKSKQHPTYQKAIESEISAGYFPYEKNNITYTKTYSPVDISGYADGGEVRDNTYVAPVYKEQVFIPATGAQKIKNDYQYKYGSKSPYKGGELEIVSPEFDVLTGIKGMLNSPSKINTLTKELNKNIDISTLNNQLPNNIGWGPKQSIKVIHDSNQNTSLNLYNTNRWDVVYEGANPHGIWFQGKFGNPRTTANTSIPGKSEKAAKARKLFEERPYRHKGELVLEKPLVTVGDVPDRSFLSYFGDKIGADGIIYNNVYDNGYGNNQVILSFKHLNDYNITNKYADGGIIDEDPPQNTSERPITNFDPKGDPYNPTYGYNPGAGYVSNSDPLGSLYVEGALLNPVFKLAGNAVSNVARGLTKYSSKYVPEVKRTVQDKINSLFRREAEDKARTFKLYDDAIESRNRIIEDLYSNPAYMERARQIQNTYGDNYAQVYEDIINQYNTNYWNLPNPVIKQLDAKAKMQAKDAAVNRYITRRQPAGYDDFEYQINKNLKEIDYPTTRHELGHYVDFNLAKSSNPDYSNSMFAELKRDLSKQKNPLFPDKTDYYSKGTEQKSYMNTLREYMFKNGMINNIGDKVTSRQIKKAIRSLPKDMRSIEAAYLQFATPGQYTKWFNKIPLLGTYPIVNKQFQNYEEDKDKAREQR